jgi:hypothetical protein
MGVFVLSLKKLAVSERVPNTSDIFLDTPGIVPGHSGQRSGDSTVGKRVPRYFGYMSEYSGYSGQKPGDSDFSKDTLKILF